MNNYDTDGAELVRLKYAPVGWTYQIRSFEFDTSKRASLINLKEDNTSGSDIALKFFEADGDELVQGGGESDADFQTRLTANCVETRLDFEPIYDYEIVSGFARIATTPSNPVRVSCVAVPDLTYEQGGSRVMVKSVNFKFITSAARIDTDGRASKRLNYNATYHTNKLRFRVFHTVGEQHSIIIAIEHYLA